MAWFGGLAQLVLQVPQWLRLVSRLTSQPLSGSPSQSLKVALQAMWQAPPTHEGVPFCDEQARLQPLQWAGSLVVSVSQPSPGRPLQSPKPTSQPATWQAPATQL